AGFWQTAPGPRNAVRHGADEFVNPNAPGFATTADIRPKVSNCVTLMPGSSDNPPTAPDSPALKPIESCLSANCSAGDRPWDDGVNDRSGRLGTRNSRAPSA